MLQQTQVETVKPYFERFLAAYPTVEALAAAPIEDVLKLWEGLGYYSRARNLHRAAQQIVERGGFPQTVAGLLELSGIGRYSAGAIASIAFDQRVPVVDGNVIRIFSRVCDLNADVTLPATQNEHLADRRGRAAGRASRQLQSSADGLGAADLQAARAAVRRRARSASTACAYQRGTQTERPVKPAKAKTPHYDVTAGIIWNARGEVLIAQRPLDGLLGGLWEFPGGKQEAGESLPECLQARTARGTRHRGGGRRPVHDALSTVSPTSRSRCTPSSVAISAARRRSSASAISHGSRRISSTPTPSAKRIGR